MPVVPPSDDESDPSEKLSLTHLCFESILLVMPGAFLGQAALLGPEGLLLLLVGGTLRKEHGPCDSQRKRKAGLRAQIHTLRERCGILVACVCLDFDQCAPWVKVPWV